MGAFWKTEQWTRLTPGQQVLAVFLRCQANDWSWHSAAAAQLRKDASLDPEAVKAFDQDYLLARAVVS